MRLLACCGLFVLAVPFAHGAVITVNSVADTAADDGVCTLREAIIAANTNTASGAMPGECAAGAAGLDTIAFAIPGAGVKTMTRTTALPAITEAVIIDGYTQPGSSANTNALNAGINAVVLIELPGASGDGVGGLIIRGDGTVVRGLNFHGSGDQITINASNVTIAGNFLGTNPTGTAVGCPTCGGFGIRLDSCCPVVPGAGDNIVIGGPAAADRNLISGNPQGGIFLGFGNGALIQGNYIGTDITGTVALVTLGGVGIGGVPDSTTTIVGNLISGNDSGGIQVAVDFTKLVTGVVIQGNLIGTQPDGVSPLGNNFGIAVGGNGYLIGGTSPGQGNVIAFNQIGVIDTNNFVNDAILGNSIFNNEFRGIALTNGGPLPNDSCDTDTQPGGNNRQNYPIITSALVAGGNVTISGTLNSTLSTTFRLEFFSNQTCDANISGASSGTNGEGQTYLGFANVTTDASCNASFGPLVFAVPSGQTIFTATATDPNNNTSEFSACLIAGGGPSPTPTTTPTATLTPTPTTTPGGASPTATPTPPANGPTVPTLSMGMLLALGAALALTAVLLLRKNR